MGTKTVRRAYRFRFYPTAEQENLLRRTLGCCRKVYNLALDVRSTAWTARKEKVTYSDTSRMLTEWKRTDEYSYLSEVPSVPLQQSLRHLQRAFSNFFGKTGDYPKFKAKHSGGSATYAATAFIWDWERQALTLAKMKEPLPVRWSRTLPRKAQPSSVTVSLDAAGRWHVSILVEDTVSQLPHADGMVGIDLGTEHFAILSTGEKIDNPPSSEASSEKARTGAAQALPNPERKQQPRESPIEGSQGIREGQGLPDGLPAQALDPNHP